MKMELKVMEIKEDGTAICNFEMTNEELISMAKIGILAALRNAIEKLEDVDESEFGEVSEGC
jgi:hypothetical protein